MHSSNVVGVKMGVGLSCAVRCLKEVGKRSVRVQGRKRWECFGKSMNVWNIVVVHLKGNTSSIKQTWWTGTIHQSAAWISYRVQLRRDKCRTSSVCPRLPIDGDHHCDVAFYLTTCSLKLYIIPNTEISKQEEGWEGHEPDCIFYSQNVWALFVGTVFTAFDDQPCPLAGKFSGFLLGFVPAVAVGFILGLFLCRWISLQLMSLLAEGLNSLNTSLLPLSGTYSNVSNPTERKASWVDIDLCHYEIPCQ